MHKGKLTYNCKKFKNEPKNYEIEYQFKLSVQKGRSKSFEPYKKNTYSYLNKVQVLP